MIGSLIVLFFLYLARYKILYCLMKILQGMIFGFCTICDKIYIIRNTDKRLNYNARKYLNIIVKEPIAGNRYICDTENGLEYISKETLENRVKTIILLMVNIPRDIARMIIKLFNNKQV